MSGLCRPHRVPAARACSDQRLLRLTRKARSPPCPRLTLPCCPKLSTPHALGAVAHGMDACAIVADVTSVWAAAQCGPCLQQGRQHALQPHCAARRGREAGPAEDIDDASTSGVDDIDIDHASNGAIALDGGSMAKVCVLFLLRQAPPLPEYVRHAVQTFLLEAGVVIVR